MSALAISILFYFGFIAINISLIYLVLYKDEIKWIQKIIQLLTPTKSTSIDEQYYIDMHSINDLKDDECICGKKLNEPGNHYDHMTNGY